MQTKWIERNISLDGYKISNYLNELENEYYVVMDETLRLIKINMNTVRVIVKVVEYGEET